MAHLLGAAHTARDFVSVARTGRTARLQTREPSVQSAASSVDRDSQPVDSHGLNDARTKHRAVSHRHYLSFSGHTFTSRMSAFKILSFEACCILQVGWMAL